MELTCASEIPEPKLLLPPSPGTFQDREDLIKYVREFGVSQGYVVTIKKSKKDRRVILGCDRGGSYRNRRKIEESKRKRKANSRLINCPFEAIGKKDDDVWVLTIKNSEHNHEPLEDMSEHPYSRRFTEEEVQQIKQMTEAGVKPRQVLKALKQSNPDLQSTPRHLYNVKAKIRQGLSEKSFKSWRPTQFVHASASTEMSIYTCPPKLANYIGGELLESQACEVIDVINPATQEVLSQVPMTTCEELKAAVLSAKQAFPAWKNTPVSTRQRIMFKLQELIRRDIDKISMSITAEQGQTLACSRRDVLSGLELVEQACGIATLQMGKYVPNAANGIDTFCIREPLGVCAGICLSNVPAMIPLWMFPIAVTCGNTFILKPSEKNPGASMMIAALATEAGLPEGVLNIVHANLEIVNNICDDDDIKAISLVSSNTVGNHISDRAAARGKRVQFNIEAKSHIVIMADASADAALDAIFASGFGASGIEKFMSPTVAVFVGGSIAWEHELVERAKLLKINAGTEAGTDIGPVISKESKDRTCRLIQSAMHTGARLILDGRHIRVPRYEKGNFLGPTIVCDVTTSMDCYKENMVGPVLLCMQIETLEEAIHIVNSGKHGNGASIFTSSCVAARKFQNEVETGLVAINVPLPLSLPLSMCYGSKASFTEDLNFCGKVGVRFYTRKKTVVKQWKELPKRRVTFPQPPTPDTGTSELHPSDSERNFAGCAVSLAMPLSIFKESQNSIVPLSFLPPAEEDLPIPEEMPSNERQLSRNQDSIPSSTPDRTLFPQTSQWVETRSSLPSSENVLSSSQRIFTPLGNETDINRHPVPERVYIPTESHQNETSSQRSHSATDNLFSSVLRRNDDLGLVNLSREVSGLDNLNVAYRTNEVLPQTTNATAKLYLPSTVRGNEGASSSSERIFIPPTSQEMYAQTQRMSMDEYHGQGVS